MEGPIPALATKKVRVLAAITAQAKLQRTHRTP